MGGPDEIFEFKDVRRQAGSGGGNPSRSLFSQGFPHPSLGAPNGPARVGIMLCFTLLLLLTWRRDGRKE